MKTAVAQLQITDFKAEIPAIRAIARQARGVAPTDNRIIYFAEIHIFIRSGSRLS